MTLIEIWNDLLVELMDRVNMPQIDQSDMPAAFKILSDSGIGVTMKSILPTALSHSQSKVNKTKVQSILRDIKSGKTMPPIVVSSDNYIIDGHHRQVAYKIINPQQPIRVVEIDLPRDAAIKAYKKVEDMV